MTDEYTPTTDKVRHAYVNWFGSSAERVRLLMGSAFDRWLAAHDAEIRAERDSLARLHEIATERTVQLAAVIEKARAWNDHGTGQPTYWDLHYVLATADTDAALRERDAEKAAYDELRTEYADYRSAVRAAVAKVVDATQRGNIMTPPWVEEAIQDLRTMSVPRASESGPDRIQHEGEA